MSSYGDMPGLAESAAGSVTVVRPKRPGTRARLLAGVGSVAVLWIGLGLLTDAAVAFVVAVVVVLSVVAAATKLCNVWRRRDGAVPSAGAQLQVSRDRVVWRGRSGERELERSHGDVLGVREVGREVHLCIVGADDRVASIGLAGFDLDEVRAAVVEWGWRWQLAEQTSGAWSGHELVLREGSTENLPAPAVIGIAATATVSATVVAVGVGVWTGRHGWVVYVTFVAVMLLGVAALVIWAMLFTPGAS